MKIQINATIDPDIRDWIVALAAKDSRNFSSQLNKLLRDLKNNQTKK